MTNPAPQKETCLTLARILGEETELLHGPFADDHPLKVLERAAPSEASDKQYLEALTRHIHACHPKRAGLCLSGGGIRSATFGLGVLQSLARLQLLDKFDYLSTVSGGGYIGAMYGRLVATYGLPFEFARDPRRRDTRSGLGRGVYQVMAMLAPFLQGDSRQLLERLSREYVTQ